MQLFQSSWSWYLFISILYKILQFFFLILHKHFYFSNFLKTTVDIFANSELLLLIYYDGSMIKYWIMIILIIILILLYKLLQNYVKSFIM